MDLKTDERRSTIVNRFAKEGIAVHLRLVLKIANFAKANTSNYYRNLRFA